MHKTAADVAAVVATPNFMIVSINNLAAAQRQLLRSILSFFLFSSVFFFPLHNSS